MTGVTLSARLVIRSGITFVVLSGSLWSIPFFQINVEISGDGELRVEIDPEMLFVQFVQVVSSVYVFMPNFPAECCGIQHDDVEIFNISDTQVNVLADARVVIHLLTLKCNPPLVKEPSREEIKLAERMASILNDFEAR
ncbi:unnamed protein product [Heligmosomoides polygyrus]|uniref:Secreted protein n=1 Tax=Heligmosomoides polygyrus TaxID=6339 RepID=A0A183GJ14_HELPZ|nr:unnamed protein product [Heligmosomoides polygyrus]